MAPSRKRQKVEIGEDKEQIPFAVRIIGSENGRNRRRPNAVRKKVDVDVDEGFRVQRAPFQPSGVFKTHDTMDVHFVVEPSKEWTAMISYKRFKLHGVQYESGSFVHVANDSSIERQKVVASHEPEQPRQKSDEDWVAHILEIRASDTQHVYARVYWMYRPEELPDGTQYGKKRVQGRQPYHGMNELIASNHMDIIDVNSVTCAAQVKQWSEGDEEIQHALFWRQAVDVRTWELSTIKLVCSCDTPENPDKLLIGCTAEHCKVWLHEQCIIDEAQETAYKGLRPDNLHCPAEHLEKEKEGSKASNKIHVKDNTKAIAKDENRPQVSTKRSAESMSNSEHAKSSRHPKKKVDPDGASLRTWIGTVDVSIKMDSEPPVLTFWALIESACGGEKKEWTESLKCLVCGSVIH